MTSIRLQSAFFLGASLLAVTACTPEPCSVEDNGDGTYTLSCPDGTSATLQNGVDGADGSDGSNGVDGSNGTDGSNGSDGISWLVDTAEEPAGENCSEGGLLLSAGPDLNANGTLETGEVSYSEYVCDGASGSGYHIDLDFPSEDSVLYSGSTTTTLGAGGGGSVYLTGSYVEETFSETGLSSVEQLNFSLTMYDATSSSCTVGTLSFAVSLNGTEVGTYSFEGGSYTANILFNESLSFSAVSGTGTTGDSYTLRVEAQESVCGGGGSYNWFPGGHFIVAG